MHIIKIRPHPQDTPTLDVFDGQGFVACLVGVVWSNSGCGCRLVGALPVPDSLFDTHT